jgi:hypothetical protein
MACRRPRRGALSGCGREGRARLRGVMGRWGSEHRWLADMRLDRHGLPIGADGDRPMGIGAKDVDARRLVALDDRRMRMAKAIVPLHGKYRDTGSDGPHERLAARCAAAVMGRFH